VENCDFYAPSAFNASLRDFWERGRYSNICLVWKTRMAPISVQPNLLRTTIIVPDGLYEIRLQKIDGVRSWDNNQVLAVLYSSVMWFSLQDIKLNCMSLMYRWKCCGD